MSDLDSQSWLILQQAMFHQLKQTITHDCELKDICHTLRGCMNQSSPHKPMSVRGFWTKIQIAAILHPTRLNSLPIVAEFLMVGVKIIRCNTVICLSSSIHPVQLERAWEGAYFWACASGQIFPSFSLAETRHGWDLIHPEGVNVLYINGCGQNYVQPHGGY